VSAKPCNAHRSCMNGRVAVEEAYSHAHTGSHSLGEHELGGLSVGGERGSTTTHAARSATLLSFDVDVSRQGASHTRKCLPCLLFRTYLTIARHGRLPHIGLSVEQACFHSRVSPFSSVFCAALLQAQAHRSGIFRPSSVLSLAVPVIEQLLTPARRLSSTSALMLETLFSSNAGRTVWKPCKPSLASGPGIRNGLNLTPSPPQVRIQPACFASSS
jgi:hypothetical protein